MYTSPEEPVLAHIPPTAPQKAAGQEQDQAPQPAVQKVPAGPAVLAGDSKVVATWKAAHAKAGLPCHVSARTGFQLGLLAKAEPPIPYHDVVTLLIPLAVAEWTSLCQYLAGYLGVALWGKKPMPNAPHAGFLLKFRKGAYAYCSMDPETRQHLVNICAKDLASAKQAQPAHPLEYE